LVFNYCLYGNIYDGDELNSSEIYLTATFYRKELDYSIYKEYICTDKYQVNLGDRDLLGINSSLTYGDVITLEFYSDADKTDKIYSNTILLDNNNLYNYDVSLGFTDNSDEANLNVTEKLVKVAIQNISESSTNLYNYYRVTNLDDDVIVKESNNSFEFIPTVSAKFEIFQRALNVNNSISEKSYEYNAIVSGTSISRSSKCKSINDTIKILILAYDGIEPEINIFKDDDLEESGTMAYEGQNLYSYNYTFNSDGYYLFQVNSDNESYIIDYRVNQNNLKFYYLEDSLENDKNIEYSVYYINDVNTSIYDGTFTSIGNGIYSSELLSVEYGDYMIVVDDEYVISFEECIGCEVSDTNSIYSTSEEIYWIFPDKIGD